ncbi:MAG: STAS domain-containing protein [Bacteroidetes bacterium]|nr:STAS domain-containing protein [Bacteroidota bacterium]
MNFETTKDQTSATIYSHVERLNAQNAPDLKSEMVLLNNQGINNIIVDLSATKYCDSSGLSALLMGNRLCKDSSGKFILCGIQENVLKMIKIAQLDKVILVENNQKEAVEALQK